MKTTRASYVILATVVLACLALPPARGAGTINPKPEASAPAATPVVASTPAPEAPAPAAPATAAAPASKGKVAGKGKAAPGATNAAPAQLPIPVSVFDLAMVPAIDPFFPKTLRHPAAQKTNDKVAPAISAHSFQLMALSGSSDLRLAMINHRTAAVGEAIEVTTSSGRKANIRVVQINESSVMIRVISPPQPDLIELSLSKRAQ